MNKCLPYLIHNDGSSKSRLIFFAFHFPSTPLQNPKNQIESEIDSMMAVTDEPKQTGLEAIKYQRGKLDVLDQLKLPHEFVYDAVSTCEDAFDCIRAMRVRGKEPVSLDKTESFQLLNGYLQAHRQLQS